ncbi:unnamed protein product, partial [Rotaria magnacalcarata]
EFQSKVSVTLLNKKIHKPTDDKILDVESVPFYRFIEQLVEIITDLLQYIKSQCTPSIAALDDEQRLVEEKHTAEVNKNFTNVILIKYMIMLVKRLNALTDLPLKSIMDDIIKKIDLFYNKKETPIDIEIKIHDYCIQTVNTIVDQLKETEYYLTNPKLDFLTNLLKDLIRKRDNARGLILVSRTLYAKLMFDYFNEREDVKDIIKPGWLVGQNGVDYQNSLSEQDEALKNFRKGLSNVLIATDIVQEVQSRGRARAEKSSCFLVVDKGSKNYVKEMTNRLKELEMLEALKSWQQIPPDQLQVNLQNIQNTIINQWRQQEEIQQIMQSCREDPETMDGKVSCRSCDYYLGELSWIRKRNNNYFISQQQLVERVEVERYSNAQIFKEIQVNGKVRCGNKKCREDIGGVQQFTDRPDIKEICALACKKLKFSIKDTDNNDQVSTHKKWTEVKFKIRELEALKSMTAIPDQK